MKRPLATLTLALTLALGSALAAKAQDTKAQEQPDEVLKVNTRVVFLDALVTDKKTKAYAGDLKPEDFEVLADGRPRQISYFSRQGDAARKPLALVLVFDLERIGAGRYLRRTDIIEAMARELEKLPPGDEVAVVVLDPGGQEGKREWLTGFTRSRGQIASALSIIPKLVGEGGFGGDHGGDESGGSGDGDQSRSVSVTIGGGGGSDMENHSSVKSGDQTKPLAAIEKARKGEFDEGDEVETVVNSRGQKVTRVLKADGTLVVTKMNKKGEEQSEAHDEFDLPRATYEATRRIARERPNSQPAIVYITDGIALMDFDERDYVEDRLIRRNVIFSAMVGDMKTGFRLAKPILSPLGNWAGVGIYGVSQHVARATGGDVVRVHGPSDYARGLSQIVGNLTARYSLGFALADAETDDGQLHPLEVRVRARDAKGKERKLDVRARRGYFMPDAPKQQEAKKDDAAGAAQSKNK